MTLDLQKRFLSQLDHVISISDKINCKSDRGVQKIISMSCSAIEQISGRNSMYTRLMKNTLARRSDNIHTPNDQSFKVDPLIGIVEALREDIKAGFVQSVEEIIRGELFTDFLDMASHLLEEGYKDPAAVIAGGAIEAHLRQLCEKNSIDTNVSTHSGVRPKKANQMNADLVKIDVYSKLDQKNGLHNPHHMRCLRLKYLLLYLHCLMYMNLFLGSHRLL